MFSTYSFPAKILFGPGSVGELPAQLEAMGLRRPLLVTDPGVAKSKVFERIHAVSGGAWPVFSQVHGNPIEEDVEGAVGAYASGNCDAVIAVGGGSAMDVGKAVRLRIRRPEQKLGDFDDKADWSGLAPFIAIPTTAGTGSEVGRSAVIILGARKRVIFNPALLAGLVILDPELTAGLPPHLTAATGADALTHCIESFTSPVFHPICDAVALEGIHLIAGNLRRAVEQGSDIEARGRMQMAAMMGGIAFQKDLGAVHSLAHPLSTLCGLHHGLANALCLPWVMEFNAHRKPELYRRVGVAMGLRESDDGAVIAAVRLLLEGIGIRGGLGPHGVKETDLEPLADQAFEDSCHKTNPVPVSREDLLELYRKAF